jgi:hypothetical protein
LVSFAIHIGSANRRKQLSFFYQRRAGEKLSSICLAVNLDVPEGAFFFPVMMKFYYFCRREITDAVAANFIINTAPIAKLGV